MTKVCSKCKRELTETHFYKCGTKLQNYCKSCYSKYAKNYYSNEDNKIQRRKTIKKYKLLHKNVVEERIKRWRNNNPKRSWIYGTLGGHKKDGHKIMIDIESLYNIILYIENCSICNKTLNWRHKGRGPKPDSPTIDRINNDNEININNIMIICNQCNTTKGSRTFKEFIKYCHYINEKFYIEE